MILTTIRRIAVGRIANPSGTQWHSVLQPVAAWPFCVVIVALISCLAFSGQRLSAQDAASGADVKTLVNQAYEASKGAKSVDDNTKVIGLCDQVIAAKPSAANVDYAQKLSSWALNRRGELRIERADQLNANGETEAAAKADDEALADFEESIARDSTRWKALHNRGVSYASRKRYLEAISDFGSVIERKPDFSNAWFNRGEVRYALGEFPKAIADYNAAVRLDPNDVGAYTSRGHAYFQLRRFREAVEDYSQAIALNPGSGAARANRADAYQSLGMWPAAAEEYRRAIQLDDTLGRAYQSAAWLMATCPDARFRNSDLALQAAAKAIELDGDGDFRYVDTLAAAQANAGQFDKAQASLSKALESAPPNESQPLQDRLALYKDATPYRQVTAK